MAEIILDANALEAAALARAEYLRQLERAMMLDPDPEYRAQAKAEYLKLTSQDAKETR